MNRYTKTCLFVLVAFFAQLAAPLAAVANPAQPAPLELMGIQQGAAQATPRAAAAPAQSNWLQRTGNWLSRFGSGFVDGVTNAIPNMVRQFRENPLQTTLMVGGMVLLGAVSAPAALVVGGGLMAYAAYQTGGDPTRLGNLAGETALFAGVGMGAGRAVRALRGSSTAAATEGAGVSTVGARAPPALRPGSTSAVAGETSVAATEASALGRSSLSGTRTGATPPRAPVEVARGPNVNGNRFDQNLAYQQRCNATNGMCFVAGTLVLTAAGLVPIETIRPADVVVARSHTAGRQAAGESLDARTVQVATTDESTLIRAAASASMVNSASTGTVARTVLKTFRRQVSALVHLALADGAGHHWIVTGTPNHPFYVPAQDRYVPMGALAIGTGLQAATGDSVKVEGKTARSGRFDVYNFEVAEAHNYHVTGRPGVPAVLVHNTGVTCPTGTTAAATEAAPTAAGSGVTPPRAPAAVETPPVAGSAPVAPVPAPTAQVAPGKLDYLFGRVASNTHNAERSAQNLQQMRRLGYFDDAAGRAAVESHLNRVAADSSNIASRFTNEHGSFVIKESLLGGPSGQFAMFESCWQVLANGALRLTTVIPKGGR